MIFISTRNPRRVSEVIYSTNLIPRAIYTLFLRSTDDPTNSPNAAPRSTHDLRQSATDALESTDDPTSNLGCSDTICCAPQTPLVVRSGSRKKRHNNHHLILRNPPTWRRLDSAWETINAAGTITNREKQSTHKFNEVRQCVYVLGAREREILLIQQSIQLLQEGTLEGGKGFFVSYFQGYNTWGL